MSLKPCPFCRGPAEYAQAENVTVGLGFPLHYIRCSACGASGPIGGSLNKGKEAAVKLWNTRRRVGPNQGGT